MALPHGTKLGPYEVIGPLGSGGMGEVYRARDTRLGRDVALKVLPADRLADPARRARFEQEARTVARLSHPHIVTIHEIESAEGIDFIVMELVPGKTLDALIPRQGMRLGEALRVAIPLADALAAAHAAGVVHRDLKPGNVMVTPEGVVKVLDFGLAKLVRPDTVDSEERTATAAAGASPLTLAGTVAGTTGYMSPEQARGEAIDARTDVFAFGAVLYEMVTGRRAFAGSSSAETLAAVLKEQPKPPSELVPEVPRDLERVILRCLRKEPERRFQHMTDLKVELEEVKEESDSQATVPGVAARPSRRLSLRWLSALVGVALVSLLIGSAMRWRFRTAPALVLRSVIRLEPGYWLDGERIDSPWGFDQPTRTALVLSSDGRFIVYSAFRENPAPQAKPRLYLRRTDQLEARPIAGTEGGIAPFLSPDDRWVGFWADGRLMKVPVGGGVPVALCDAERPFGASWANDNTIVFSPSNSSGLFSVPANGGKPETLTIPDKAREELSHLLPHSLADGKGVLFTIMRETYDLEPRVALLDLKTRKWNVLLEDAADARYVPTGHLVFLRQGTLMAVRLDLGRSAVVGPPVPAIAGVVQALNVVERPWGNTGAGQLSVSDSGWLVYAPGGILPDIDSTLVWVDRKGSARPAASLSAFFCSPRLSPDGRRVTYTTWGSRAGAWVYDLDRGTATRLTGEGKVLNITWTPDGRRVAFNWSKAGSAFSLYWQPADGSSPMERLTTGEHNQWLGSFSPDATTLAFVEDRPETGADILLLDPRSRRVTPFLSSRANEVDPTFSPDGRWLAYVSDESGRWEVYVRPFPGPGGKWQISSEAGSEPLWARDGGELLYQSWSLPRKAWAVAVRTEGGFSAGKPRVLFETSGFQGGMPRCWDVSPDGQRFLMVKLEDRKPAPLTEMVLVQNWFEELRRLVPAGRD